MSLSAHLLFARQPETGPHFVGAQSQVQDKNERPVAEPQGGEKRLDDISKVIEQLIERVEKSEKQKMENATGGLFVLTRLHPSNLLRLTHPDRKKRDAEKEVREICFEVGKFVSVVNATSQKVIDAPSTIFAKGSALERQKAYYEAYYLSNIASTMGDFCRAEAREAEKGGNRDIPTPIRPGDIPALRRRVLEAMRSALLVQAAAGHAADSRETPGILREQGQITEAENQFLRTPGWQVDRRREPDSPKE